METRATRKIKVADLNSHLLCPICGGYFIDATTTIECLHSFCRSCIVRHLRTSKCCPACGVQLHKTRPLLSIRPDRTLQTLVYKLVPNLYNNEMRRRHQFVREHADDVAYEDAQRLLAEDDFFSTDDAISLSIEYYESDSSDDEEDSIQRRDRPEKIKREEVPHRRYLQCPAAVSIRHLKKFLLLKYGLSSEHRVDVIYSGEVMPDHFTLIDVAYTFSWKRVSPMMFSYRIFQVPTPRLTADSQMTRGPEEEQSQSCSTPEIVVCRPATPTVQDTDVEAESSGRSGSPDLLADQPSTKKPKLACVENDTSVSSVNEHDAPNADDAFHTLACGNVPTAAEQNISPLVLQDQVTLEKENVGEPLAKDEMSVNVNLQTDNASKDADSLNDDATLTHPKEASSSSPKTDSQEQNDIENVDSLNSIPSNECNDPDEDENVLKILSTEEDDYDDANMEIGDEDTKVNKVSEYVVINKKDVSEIDKHLTKEKVVFPEVKSKHKEGRKKSKHKSKHHHQRNGEGTTRKRKTLRAEIISTPTVLQDPEDVMKLKVKLSPTSNPVITGYSSFFNSSHHKHHHHHSKHHHSKHHYKQQNHDSSASSNRSNGEATSSAKERLLQMRAVRRKNTAAANESAEILHPNIDEFPSSKTKKSQVIMPPSSITVSKVTVSEKRKGDLQKINSENESKRPSLEIMLVNAPSTQSVGHHSNISTNSSTGNSKQVNTIDGETSPRQPELSMTTNVNVSKNVRQAASTIPLMRIKKQVSSAAIKPPCGLTITPKIGTISNKVVALAKSSPVNKHIEHGVTQSNKEEKNAEDRQSTVAEQNIRHDDIGALDLSGKSSRCKDLPGSSPSPGLEICQSNSSSNSSSPGKTTTSSPHQSILTIAQSLVHKQLTSLQQQRTSNNKSPLSISPSSNCSTAKASTAVKKISPDRGSASPQRNRNSPNNVPSNSSTPGLAPLAMSNLQTLSDTAVHIRNLMAAQGSGKNVRMNISKQQMLAANLQITQQKMASAHANSPSTGVQGRGGNSYVANTKVSTGSPQLTAAQHSRFQPNSTSTSRSATSSQQYAVAGASASSTPSPLRIPVPPSPLNKALSSVGRGTSLLNSRNSVSLPRLHDLFSTSAGGVTGRGRVFPGRNNAVAKPGPNQAVRHIPNPSALIFRHNRQQQSQAASLASRNTANSALSNTNNSNKVLFNQNENFVSGSKTHDGSSGISTMTSPSVSSIRKMENMTRNIEKVAAGLTVRAVEANMNNKL